MVKSFWSGLQQARTEVPGTSRQSQHTTLFGTPKPCPVPCHSDNVKEIFSTNEQTPDIQVNRKQTKCPGCGCICKGGQQHTCSAIVMKDPTVNEMSPNSSDNYMSQDSPRKVFLSTQDGVVSIAEKRVTSDGVNSSVGSEGKKKKDSPILSASTNPIIDLCETNPNGQSSGADFGGRESEYIEADTSTSPNIASVAIQYNVLSDTSSPIKSKRNDDAPLDLCESPLKKQKAVSDKISDATSSRDTTTVDHISAEKEYAKMNTKKKDLSDLGHKKRALKAPVSLFKGEKLKAPKIVLSEFEKEIYHLAT